MLSSYLYGKQYAIEEFNNTIDFQAILNLKFLQRYLV